MDGKPAARLRLLRVEVRPTFVLDDGEDLTEIGGPPMLIAGSQWTHFAASSFTAEDLAETLQRVQEAEGLPPLSPA